MAIMINLLTDIVKQSSKKFPKQEVFRLGDCSITYACLEQKMIQLSRVLFDLKVQKGERVGIYMGRSLETAIAVYGILNAGAVFVPLDPLAPRARTCSLIKDCGIRHLISNPEQNTALEKIASNGTKLKSIIGIKKEWSLKTISWEEVFLSVNITDPNIKILEDDLAYIMYTSGTTGTPKGIMHTHYSGLSYAKLSKNLYGLNSNDRVGNHSALHFDISTFGYFSAPLAGATTIIIPEAHTKMPASLSRLIEKEALTVWYSVPVALTRLLQSGVLEQRDLCSLRWVLFGGEPFPVKHLNKLIKLWHFATFSNVYGPAEVNQCTYYHLSDVISENESVPLGRVWDKTAMIIMDEKNRYLPTNQFGELLISSATMMQGYWGKPNLTKQAFYELKLSNGSKKIFYRTGDLVTLKPNGDLIFLGRKDRQVKVKGYRVELDEIENVIMNHEKISDAAVYIVDDETYGTLIEAVVQTIREAGLKEEILMKHIGMFLPRYAIPHKIFFVQSIPRTAAGKTDYKELQNQRSLTTITNRSSETM